VANVCHDDENEEADNDGGLSQTIVRLLHLISGASPQRHYVEVFDLHDDAEFESTEASWWDFHASPCSIVHVFTYVGSRSKGKEGPFRCECTRT
jgi:hypothetical protein